VTDADIPSNALHALSQVIASRGRVLALTGAGISAESGIPTFRGPEGYWRVGSVNYRPEELATFAAFQRMPAEIWGWYLHRRSFCRKANPNPAHLALAELERKLGDRFVLVTQNVDGLHLRAGNSLERTYQIHGNIDYVRCAAECGTGIRALPEGLGTDWPKDTIPSGDHLELLHCDGCGAFLRPHVLWFDEYYDEERYRFESSIAAIEAADLLLVIGTSGATNLPMQIVQRASQRGISILVINQDPSPFSAIAAASEHGAFLQGAAGTWLPRLVEYMTVVD